MKDLRSNVLEDDVASSAEMGRKGSENLKSLPMIIQDLAGTGLSVCKPNEIIKANLLTQHLIGNQFSLPTVQDKNHGENDNAAPLRL